MVAGINGKGDLNSLLFLLLVVYLMFASIIAWLHKKWHMQGGIKTFSFIVQLRPRIRVRKPYWNISELKFLDTISYLMRNWSFDLFPAWGDIGKCNYKEWSPEDEVGNSYDHKHLHLVDSLFLKLHNLPLHHHPLWGRCRNQILWK